MLLGWKPEIRIDDSELFACSKRNQPMAFAGYCNPRVDALLDSIARTTDAGQARAVWSRYQRLLAREQPTTLLYFTDGLAAVSPRVHGVTPDQRGDWVGIDRWWLEPGSRR